MLSGAGVTKASKVSSNKNGDATSADEQFDSLRNQLKKMLRSALMERDESFSFFTDIRVVLLSGDLIWRRIKSYQPEVLLGIGLCRMPLLHAVALAANADGHAIQVLMVREKRKKHNLKKWVEGAAPTKGATAILISDYFADADALAFVNSALKADNYLVDIQAISMVLDLTMCADLSYAVFGPEKIVSIFSTNEFEAESRDGANRLLSLIEECRLQDFSLSETA